MIEGEVWRWCNFGILPRPRRGTEGGVEARVIGPSFTDFSVSLVIFYSGKFSCDCTKIYRYFVLFGPFPSVMLQVLSREFVCQVSLEGNFRVNLFFYADVYQWLCADKVPWQISPCCSSVLQRSFHVSRFFFLSVMIFVHMIEHNSQDVCLESFSGSV